MYDWHERFDNVMRQLEREQAVLNRLSKEIDNQRDKVEELRMEKICISNELLKRKWELEEKTNADDNK
jgi:hypothetical protein